MCEMTFDSSSSKKHQRTSQGSTAPTYPSSLPISHAAALRPAMNFLLDDLVNDLVEKVQKSVVPTLEQVTHQATERFRRPPPGDLLYLTDRLIVSSAPAVAWPTPSYTDQGREDRKLWREEETLDESPEVGDGAHLTTPRPASPTTPTPTTENPQDGTTSATFQESCSSDAIMAEPRDSQLGTASIEDTSALSNDTDGVPKTVPPRTEGDSSVEMVIEETNVQKTDGNELDFVTATGVTELDAPSTASEVPVPDGAVTLDPTGSLDTIPTSNNVDGHELGDSPTISSEALESSPHPVDAVISQSHEVNHESTTILSTPNKEEKDNYTSKVGDSAIDGSQDEQMLLSTSVARHPSQTSPPASPVPGLKESDGNSSSSDDTTMAESSADVDENDAPIEGGKPPNIYQHPPTSGNSLRTSPATIISFLEKRHGRDHFLAFALTDERPDDRNLLLFRRQIVQMGWWSPCPERSETPSIPHVLQVCYAIHAYLYLDPSNVALVYCANGKTRTAIVMACYLKFVGLVTNSKDGFLKFLAKRGVADPTKTWEQLPPSLHLFFQQFDSAIHLGGFLNRKPLLLRAIALQGIPVEDKPCLDIWDSSQRHVYSSHPEIMGQEGPPSPPNLSQWADEEGFYRVNVVLDGEFLLLCRFGGDFAEDITIHDPSKILFRYTNTTGFLTGGYPYELTPDRIDLYRRYASHLDDEDFLVTLLFEASWESSLVEGETLSKSVSEQLRTTSTLTSQRIFRCQEPDAVEEGLRIIVQHHSARPNRSDIEDFQKLYHGKGIHACEDHLICIALQLSNFDMQRALSLLIESPSFSWWKSKVKSQDTATDEVPGFKWKRVKTKQSPSKRYGATAVATKEILGLLDEVLVDSSLEEPDKRQLQRSSPSITSVTEQRASVNQSTIDSQILKSGWMVPSLMYPRKGDIVGCFSDHYRQFHRFSSNNPMTPSVTATNLPRIPFFPHNKPALIPPPLAKRQRRENPPPIQFVPLDIQRESAVQFHDNINSTTVALSDLIELIEVSQTWADKPLVSDDETSDDEEDNDADPSLERSVYTREPTGSMNREAKEQKEQKWEEAKKAEAREKEKQKAEAARKKEEEEAKRKEEEQESPPTSANEGEVALKDDPEYAKYFKMLKMGMSKEQVLHAMTRDEKDHSVLDLDPNKSLKAQKPTEQGDVPLNQDPEYEKYFKMLKMGLPMGAVKNALARDGKDPSIMDLDPNKSLKSQMSSNEERGDADDGIPLKDDPEYSKYFKMLKMGLPVDAVKNALTRDGKDPRIMDLDPEKSVKSQMSGSGGDDGPPLKDDPEYAKYFKMLSMGLPIGAVKNALARDGKDPAIMDLDPNRSVKSQLGESNDDTDTGPPLKDDPEYAKYFKMLSMGLPIGAVKNALSRDGKDPSIMDLDPNKSVKSQLGGTIEKDTGIPLKDDPEYSKYFKMLGMGLPMGAVKNALERDGKNASVMDMDPNKSVAFQMKKAPGGKQPVKKKKRVRRKKIYWNPIDPSKLKEDSMWNIVRGAIAMEKLNYDEKEFEDLFTESADPADQKNNKKDTKKEEKKLVQVIDPKRSMNGGIVLARLKTDHAKIAEHVNRMDHGKFDATQLMALKEYLPDDEERRGLITYMKKGEAAPDVRERLYADCSETEKYMVTMIEVQDAAAKLDAMLFRTIFKNRFEEATEAIRTLNSACDELRSSEKLRKLMAIILTVVNQINTGGEGKMAMGFTLDALLKLNEAKAFDKKTSVLHYVVKLVKKNDETLLQFDSDIKSVVQAESVLLDGLSNDVKSVAEELEQIHETIKQEADRMEQAGELKPMSLAELTEQKTVVRVTEGVPQFNKMDHLTGRTPMERFSLNAKLACEQASVSIEHIKAKYRALLQYFGEDEQMATSDFFGTLRRFMAEWRKAVEQVEAIEKKEAKEKKRAAAKAAKEKKAGEKKAQRTAGAATSEPTPPLDSQQKRENEDTRNTSMAALAAAAAVSRARTEAKDLVATSPEDVAPVDLAVAHPTSNNSVGQNGGSVPEPIASAVAGDVAVRTDENGSSDPLSHDSFAIKAAAYRRKKERKDDVDDSKPSFLTAAMAYRKRKSQRDLASAFEDSDTANAALAEAESSTTSHLRNEAAQDHNNALDEAATLPQKSSDALGELSTSTTLPVPVANLVIDQGNGSNGDTENKEATMSNKPSNSSQTVTHSPKQCEISDRTASVVAGRKGDAPKFLLHNDVSKLPELVDANSATNAAEIVEKPVLGVPLPKSVAEYEVCQDGGDENKLPELDNNHGVELGDDITSHTLTEKSEGEVQAQPKSATEDFAETPKLDLSQLSSLNSIEVPARSCDRPLNENRVLEESKDTIPTMNIESVPEVFPTSQYATNNYDLLLNHVVPENMVLSRSDTTNHPPLTESDTDALQTSLDGDDAKKPTICSSRLTGNEITNGEAHELQNLFSVLDGNKQVEDTISDTSPQFESMLESHRHSAIDGNAANEETTAQLSVLHGAPSQQENPTKVKATSNQKVSFDLTFDQDPKSGDVVEPEVCNFESDEREMSTAGPISFIYGDDGQDLDRFFEAVNIPRHVASPDVDDSSVGIMAENLQTRNMASRLSESWVRGDTIENFMGWADEAIRASDSESVRNFEFSLDLQLNDFDDESTIATMQDDASVVSWSTPMKSTATSNSDMFGGPFDVNAPFEISEVHAVTPAQVAASILFTDSPVSQGPRTAAPSSFGQPDNDILNTALFIPNNNLSFDATRLSFAIGDVGLDDGLGFGDNGFSYGNEDDFNDLINTSMQPQSEPRSPERKSWFRWMS